VLVRGDVADGIEALADEAATGLGGLDALVVCAVLPLPRPVDELTPDDLERAMRTNFEPFARGRIGAARHIDAGGRIVGVSATGAHIVRNPRYAPLAVAKGAVETATRFLAVSLAPRGITVNSVAPGPNETEAFEAMAEDPAALKAKLGEATPMGRMERPRTPRG
jgi:NAD(P)-dependent dehydrogenase (short-subunit alcohol dehydrogenase family)